MNWESYVKIEEMRYYEECDIDEVENYYEEIDVEYYEMYMRWYR